MDVPGGSVVLRRVTSHRRHHRLHASGPTSLSKPQFPCRERANNSNVRDVMVS